MTKFKYIRRNEVLPEHVQETYASPTFKTASIWKVLSSIFLTLINDFWNCEWIEGKIESYYFEL